MNTIHKITLATALSMLGILACTSSIAAPDISGTYKCSGVDSGSPSNPNFNETIVLKKNGDVFNVQAIHSGDLVPYDIGTAIFNKDVNNAFAYTYWSVKDSSTFGIELMTIKPDGSLDGVYLDSSETKRSTETCTKSS